MTALTTLFAGMGVVMIIFAIALLVFSIIATWKVFEKAGKPGWASIVPIYNSIVLLEIIGFKWYYIFAFLLGFVPLIGNLLVLLTSVIFSIKLAKSFKQEVIFGIGIALINPVFMGIIAFNKDISYAGPVVNGDIDFKDLF